MVCCLVLLWLAVKTPQRIYDVQYCQKEEAEKQTDIEDELISNLRVYKNIPFKKGLCLYNVQKY